MKDKVWKDISSDGKMVRERTRHRSQQRDYARKS